jgi:hypothetical protein
MNDDGILRNPKWIRSHDLATRTRWAKIPPYFDKFAGTNIDNTTVRGWLKDHQPGVLTLHSKGVKGVAVAVPLAHALLKVGDTVRWIPAESYVETFKEEWDEKAQDERWRTLKYAQRAFDVLVLDGLGDEPNTDFEKKILGSLIKGRTERGLTTVLVTSYNTMDLAVYGSRVSVYAEEGTFVNLGR